MVLRLHIFSGFAVAPHCEFRDRDDDDDDAAAAADDDDDYCYLYYLYCYLYVYSCTCAGGRYENVTDGLRIKNVTLSDDGEYTCRAEVEKDGRYDERKIDVTVHSTLYIHLYSPNW